MLELFGPCDTNGEGLSTTSVDDIEYYWGRGLMILSEAVAEDQYNVS